MTLVTKAIIIKTVSPTVREATLFCLCKWGEKQPFVATFFLCSFCRSLNCSILFTSSFRNPASWMCKFPTFSISGKHQSTQPKTDGDVYEVHKRNNARNISWAYVISFHQEMFSKCCENKMNTGHIYFSVHHCRINVLLRKVDSDTFMSTSMLKCTHTHTHTYQISYNPPALRAIVTSSLPYFSSAEALQGQKPQ